MEESVKVNRLQQRRSNGDIKIAHPGNHQYAELARFYNIVDQIFMWTRCKDFLEMRRLISHFQLRLSVLQRMLLGIGSASNFNLSSQGRKSRNVRAGNAGTGLAMLLLMRCDNPRSS